MFTHWIDRMVSSLDCSPWGAVAGRCVPHAPMSAVTRRVAPPRALYTAEERRRRDASPWTLVQGVLAPAQGAGGTLTVDPDGAGPLFETPMVGAPPEDLAYIP